MGVVGNARAATNGMLGYTFQSDRATFQVGTINPDGGGNALGPEGRADPRFSPDGNRELVWSYTGFGGASLYVRKIDGTSEIPLVPLGDGTIWEASWSPDGTQIAFLLSRNGNGADSEVWTMNADGSNQVQVTNDGSGKTQIDWGMTPSGSKIAYIGARPLDPSDPCYGWQLWVMNPNGASAACVASVAAFGQDLAYNTFDIEWSPDGTRMAMAASYPSASCGAATCERVGNVWIAPIGSGAATNLTPSSLDGQLHAYDLAWSPDASKLAIAGDTPQPNPATGGVLNAGMGVYVTPAAAFAPTRITPAQPNDSLVSISAVDWQPCIAGVTTTCTSVTPPWVLTVGVSGSGRVTSSPPGIGCPSICSAPFVAGTMVTLTASPAAGSTLADWGGACPGASTTCTLSMNADTLVNVSFQNATSGSQPAGGGDLPPSDSPAGAGAPGPGTPAGACGKTTRGVYRLCGTSRRDRLIGRAGSDLIEGRAGADHLEGRGGADWLRGGAGDDTLLGGTGGDRIDGGPGADHITGGSGADLVIGGGGDDVIDVRDGTVDIVRCGSGRDTVRADPKDVLIGCELRHLR